MFTVHRSNRLEPLVERLAAALSEHRQHDPMALELVAVASRGMERWVTQQLAERLPAQVCAGVAFPFTGAIVHRAMAAALGQGAPEADPWSPERAAWRVLELLPELLDDPTFAPLAAHLRDCDGEVVAHRRMPLARRIADQLDRYAVYRPEMVAAWRAGRDTGPADEQGLAAVLPEDQRWQPALWRLLADRIGVTDLADRFDGTVTALRTHLVELGALPPRLAVFGVTALPPAHLRVLDALATHRDIDLYLLSPSPKLWDDNEVDPLLGSLGRLGRDAATVIRRSAPGAVLADAFVAPGATGADDVEVDGTALQALQAVIHRGQAQRQPVQPHDRTVAVHGAHGRTRQVEVLREALIGLLDADRSLEPRDILVMAPDIEGFAPTISAVFSDGDDDPRTGPSGTPALPFRIADRSVAATNPVAAALEAVLDLVDGRVEASAVLDVLRAEPVRARFDLDVDDLATVEGWVGEAGIRWGIDARHRAAHGLPDDSAHTWRFGLDRLLLGVAMADEDHRSYGDVVPFDDVEGDHVDLLGRLATACDALFGAVRDLAAPRPVEAWRHAIDTVLAGLFAVDEDQAWQPQQVRDALEALVEHARDDAGLPSDVELTRPELREVLTAVLTDRGPSAAYLTGAITFSGLVPMRAVPYRVICLLGMDDGLFPRTSDAVGFDLVATAPRPGDRDPRSEDRALLLDAVLAARDHLLITYTARDPRTNEERQPAVPVSELLDALDAAVAFPDERPARDHLVALHPLQPFSPRAFGGGLQPPGHDRRHLAAAVALAGEQHEPPSFFPGPLAPPSVDDLDPERVEVADLVRFFDNPAKHLLTRRVRVHLAEDVDVVEDRDPVDLGDDHLGRWRIGDALLAVRVDGDDEDAWREALLRRGSVPVGTPGRYEVAAIARVVDEILAEEGARLGADVERLDVDVPLDLPGGGRVRLVGTVDGIRDEVLLTVQYSNVSAKHRLRQWIRLLAATAAAPDVPWSARLAGRQSRKAKRYDVPPLGEDAAVREATARAHLGRLLACYVDGHRAPLPFMPVTSEAFAAVARSRGEDSAWRRAAERWDPPESDFGFPDGHDAYVAQAFGQARPLQELAGFAELARTVWDPVLDVEQPA